MAAVPPTLDDLAPPPAAPPWIEPVVGRDAVPPVEATLEAERRLLEEHGQRLAENKLEDQANLARELIKNTDPRIHNNEERFARLQLARRLAGEAADFATAMTACDELAKWYDVDLVRTKAAVLAKYAPLATTPQHHEALAEACIRIGFEAIGNEDYRFSPVLSELATKAAAKAPDTTFVWRAEFLAQEAVAGRTGFRRIRHWVEKLREDPKHAEANLNVGKFLCFVKNDWETGLSMLAQSHDSDFQGLAEEELKKPDTSPKQIDLGHRWWTRSQKPPAAEQQPCRERARFWYLKGLASEESLTTKVTLKKELEPRVKLVSPQRAELRIRDRSEGWDSLNIYSDKLVWWSSHGPADQKSVNHVSWSNVGMTPEMKNAGATRLLPEEVDFSTARMTVHWSQWPWSSVLMETFEDHVHVRFLDNPGGASSFDVSVAFDVQDRPLGIRVIPEWDVRFFGSDKWNEPIPSDEFWTQLVAQSVEPRRSKGLNYQWGKFEATRPFASLAESKIDLPAGTYEIRTVSDDGIRVWVNDKKVIERWDLHGATEDLAVIDLPSGAHRLRVEHFDAREMGDLHFWMRMLK
jgi:hypothetical protein